MFNSNRFCVFRHKSGMSCKAFGKACRPPVDKIQVQRWERGYETPDAARVADIARVLRVDKRELTLSTRDVVLRAIETLERLEEAGQAPPGYNKKKIARLRRVAEQLRD